MLRYVNTLAVVWFFLAQMLLAQTSDVHTGSVRLFRYGDLLRAHNVDLTEPALIQALKNSNSDVRFLAAMKLAEDKAVDAIPDVKQALAAETVPRTKVNLALALGLLDGPGGVKELKKLCSDTNFPAEFRLSAARYMFDLHDEKNENCLHAAEQIVQVVNPDTIGNRVTALSLLTRFKDLSSEESQEVFRLVAERLNDPEPTVRIQAGQSLVSLGNPGSIALLREAVAREKDEAVRPTLERDLASLQGQPEFPGLRKNR